MGSATREALAAGRSALANLGSGVDVTSGDDLFTAAQALGSSRQLLSALTDPSAPEEAKVGLVRAVFGRLSGPAVVVLEALAASRWSHHRDILTAVEELAIRAIAASAPSGLSIESELFAFERAVASDAELELALGSKLGDRAAKAALVDALLAGKASAQTLAIVRHVVAQPLGRSVSEVLSHAAIVVADQAGERIATVTTAAPLDAGQFERLRGMLSARYGRSLQLNQVVDTSVLGGVRVQIGDDVIDGSIATRLAALRLQLAG